MGPCSGVHPASKKDGAALVLEGQTGAPRTPPAPPPGHSCLMKPPGEGRPGGGPEHGQGRCREGGERERGRVQRKERLRTRSVVRVRECHQRSHPWGLKPLPGRTPPLKAGCDQMPGDGVKELHLDPPCLRRGSQRSPARPVMCGAPGLPTTLTVQQGAADRGHLPHPTPTPTSVYLHQELWVS